MAERPTAGWRQRAGRLSRNQPVGHCRAKHSPIFVDSKGMARIQRHLGPNDRQLRVADTELMLFDSLLLAFSGVLLAQLSPGPNLFAVAKNALGLSRAHGVTTALGVACGTALYGVLAFAGLGALLNQHPQLLIAIQLAGGSYLCWMGFNALRSMRKPVQLDDKQDSPLNLPAAWRHGFWILMTNPKAALMWTAIAAFLQPTAMHWAEQVVFSACVGASAFTIYSTYAVIFSNPKIVAIYLRQTHWFSATFGAVFTGLGLSLLWQGLREI